MLLVGVGWAVMLGDEDVVLFTDPAGIDTEVAFSWSLDDFPRVRMLAALFVDLTLPLPEFDGTVNVAAEVAADGDKYGEEGTRDISLLFADTSSSGTLLRLRLEEAILLELFDNVSGESTAIINCIHL